MSSSDKPQVRHLIDELRSVVARPGDLDAAAKAELGGLLNDIEALLDASSAEDESLNDQVTRMASEFEADHPKAARLLENIADTLSKLGI